MIEGGGLGVFAPEDVGPVSVQVPNGVVDVLCADEKEAVEVARRYLSYFQGDVPRLDGADQDLLRDVVPPDRRRVYDVRRALELLADEGSVLELRPSFAPGMVTALARVEGRPVGVIANNPMHLAGAIDAGVRRQGGPLHAAVRGVRPAAAVPVRHARASWWGPRRRRPPWCAT